VSPDDPYHLEQEALRWGALCTACRQRLRGAQRAHEP
jgi:hypothetical protein